MLTATGGGTASPMRSGKTLGRCFSQKVPPETEGLQGEGHYTMAMFHPTHVRWRRCGMILPGWLPVAKSPHAMLLMDHLGGCNPYWASS